jgi:tetratricopeptide (TPR) repeat protein
MSFICQNPTCAIAISKQEFAKQLYDILKGKCPECQGPLLEDNFLREDDEKLIAALPYVIAYPLKQTLLAKDPFKRINLFKDTFLNYLKYLGLLSASEFFNSHIKDRGMVSLFHQNLSETAFGKWNHYIRETLKFLKEKNHQFFCPELLAYYEQIESGKNVKHYKGEIEYLDANGDLQVRDQKATSIGMLINFRNKYLGHGTMPDDEKSIQLWNEYFPIFRSLLEQMIFAKDYPMLKKEEGQTWLLQSSDIVATENKGITDDNIWIQNAAGNYLSILPFFIVPGELAIQSSEKAKLFTYESYTGKTIKFFSPEGVEKQTSGKILDRLNLLLRDKQKEIPFTPETFTKEVFLKRIEEENKLHLDTLISEKKIIPGVYQHRENIEIKLREWIGARANIFFIAAEAGSGKTNLLAEIQKQYTERGYPGLLIRAGRMEKSTLKEQVAYLLNIDANEGLDKYTAIAGTQAEPTFILIDGLNEANNAEAIWQEIMDWSKIIEPGSIKFVVTSRANTKADLERYKTEEADLNFLYGENKDHEKGLGAYAFWLTPLDMNEMKGAWENYVAKDKSRYKPLFSFDDIATFDRAIYNQINNPLVLRLFLEIYNGKNLPKKGGMHLHIWKDWFNTFSHEEQTFLKLLADEVWLKGENELLHDDLLNNEKVKSYLTTDLVNSPYARMKNMGWVSRYVRDMNGCLGFTVEGALLYLVGKQLQQKKEAIDLAYVHSILKDGTQLQKSGIESYLCEESLKGKLNLVTELIDAGEESKDMCIRPLLLHLKVIGVEQTISKVLDKPTENDWKAMLKLDDFLESLQSHVLRKVYLNNLITIDSSIYFKENIQLTIRALNVLDNNECNIYLEKIYTHSDFIQQNENLLFELGKYYFKIGEYKKSIEINEKCFKFNKNIYGLYYDKNAKIKQNIGNAFFRIDDMKNSLINYNEALDINLQLFGVFALQTGEIFNSVGAVLLKRKDLDKALQCFVKSNKIKIDNVGEIHPSIANTYNNIALVWKEKKDYNKALEYFKSAQDIREKIFGKNHLEAASTFLNIGNCYMKMGDYIKALESHFLSLNIKKKFLPDVHHSIGYSLKNIGLVYFKMSDFENSIIYYEENLKIRIKIYGEDHPNLEILYRDIAQCQFEIKNYSSAIESFKKGFDIKNSHYSLTKIAECYEALGNKHEALSYFIKSLEFGKDQKEFSLNDNGINKFIINSKRLAIELNKEIELPDWIKNYSRGGENE